MESESESDILDLERSRIQAVSGQTAIGALRRTTVCTRQRLLGGVGESGDGDYESVVLERAV